jgi:hypothetical protein
VLKEIQPGATPISSVQSNPNRLGWDRRPPRTVASGTTTYTYGYQKPSASETADNRTLASGGIPALPYRSSRTEFLSPTGNAISAREECVIVSHFQRDISPKQV